MFSGSSAGRSSAVGVVQGVLCRGYSEMVSV